MKRKSIPEHEHLLKSDAVRKRSLGNCYQKIGGSCILTAGKKPAIQKLVLGASLQRARTNALRKLSVVASLQPTEKTAIRKLVIAASSVGQDDCYLKMNLSCILPAAFTEASCCWQLSSARGLGEAPLDNTPIP